MRARGLSPWILALAFALGAWLRLDQLLVQVPAGDEWHALWAVNFRGLDWILTHFGISDYSIPLAVYYELLARTIGLEEIGLRLPMLLTGLASIVLLPLLVRPLVGARAAHGFAFLLAASPILVYYSRYARPYAPATLAACVALVAAWRWRAEGGRVWAGTYAACAVLATWFLPVYGPLVLAPWVFLFAESLVRRGRAPHAPVRVIALGVGIGVVVLTLLVPPLVNDLVSLTVKMSEGETVNVRTVRQVANLFAGTVEPSTRWAVLALAALGGLVMLRRAPSAVGYLAFVFGLQVIALLVANPAMIHAGITLGRYLLPLQLVLLLGLAVLLGESDRWLSRGRLSEALPLSALALGAFLFVRGPLPEVLERPNSFTNHAWHQYAYDKGARAGIGQYWGRHRKKLPPFFYELAELEPGSVRLLEAPWFYPWQRIKMREAQAVHRQHVTVGFLGRDLNPENELTLGEEFRFRTFVDVGDHDEVVRRGFDYVVFHNDLTRELKKSGPLSHISLGDHLEEYRARFGAPVYEDKRLTVFRMP